ncbi:Acyl-CoA dehydrogenase, C-terminal domain [Musa troglodytarum]|uniref:Dynein light chain n=1 Tax=Musa troglodytarum TaxID=320322 RepID=A0A9E7H3B5_9LILI|nr:Acyl-CoA dehydrogenase, C-terminal domain [Musa troglodytarum]
MAEESKSGGVGAVAQAATSPKIVMKSIDMSEKMRNDAIDCARAAFEKHRLEKEIAEYIKKEFDKKYGQTWHCIVGRNFVILQQSNASSTTCKPSFHHPAMVSCQEIM